MGNRSGGGIYAGGGTLTVNDSLITNNSASQGGGIATHGSLVLNNSSIVGNTSTESGGGIRSYYVSSTLTVTNSTIAFNRARYGGGIGTDGGTASTAGPITLSNSAVVFNSSVSGGGGIEIGTSNPARTEILENTLIFDNEAPTGPDCNATVDISSHNIFGNIANCTRTSITDDQVGVDPLLAKYPMGALRYYVLQSGSPAIDNADGCLSTDQRGLARPQGPGCDIGPYEYAASAGAAAQAGVSAGSDQRTTPGTTFDDPLTAYVTDAQGSPVPGIEVTFTAPGTGASGTFENGEITTSVTTDAYGAATSTAFTANDLSGTYLVAADVDVLEQQLQFTLTNGFWYVNGTRPNDNGDCKTPATACRTIEGAMEKAASGDTIRVAAGIHTSYSTIAVVQLLKDMNLDGGWDETFTSQSGQTVLDGGESRRGIVVASGVTAELNRISASNGLSSAQGGGISNKGNLTLRNLSVDHNAANMGGGIYSKGKLTLRNVTVDHNTANYGGGIYHESGDIIVANTTISNNTSSHMGGGIEVRGGTVDISNSTITQNVSTYLARIFHPEDPSYGGGIDGGPVTITNTIIAGNTAVQYPDCHGSLISGGHNLIGFSNGCTLSGGSGDLVGSWSIPVGAKLGSLRDNGGPTLTHALLAGSPAIDAGDPATCEAADQRGVSRPQGAVCDMGAFEGSESQVVVPALRTYNAKNDRTLPGELLCDETMPLCTNGWKKHADNAQLHAKQAIDFYSAHFQRDGIDNNFMPVISTVEFDYHYDNAFWNGAQMVYGDWSSWPLADDVVAHELTHGVTQYESGLFYYYQSGAINESISDIFGELLDQTNGSGTDAAGVRWLLGEDVSGHTDGPFRSMSNPPAYGGVPADPIHPTSGDPDRINHANYYIGPLDNGGVHTNSGVSNKAAYLMVDGGTFNGKTVTALGADRTLAIYYEAQVNLLTSGSDYGDLYYILPQACLNLVGESEGITAANCLEVQDAVAAVAMNAQPASASSFNRDAPLCGAGLVPSTDLFIDNMEAGAEKWSLETPRWQLDAPYYGSRAHSGEHSLYADDMPDDVAIVSATMKSALVLPAKAYLHFAHAYDFEYYYIGDPNWYDGGVLEYGVTGEGWKDAGSLFDYNGYDDAIYAGYPGQSYQNNPLKGRQAFVGTSHGYISSRANLATLAGKNVKFRWRMGLDYVGAGGGWWLDDVRIYTCVHPSTVAISGSTGVAGATLAYGNGGLQSTTSDSSGQYSITVPRGWSGTVTPVKTGCTFSPPSTKYSNVTAGQIGNYAPSCSSVFRSVGAQDGWLLESSETSSKAGSSNSTATTLNLGDDAADRQYRGILSFDTSSIPDTAVFTAVTLKMKRSGEVGGADPFVSLGNIVVDIKKGSWSGNSALQLTDFYAAGTKNYVMQFTNTPVSGWYSTTLGATGYGYINKTGPTQFRLRFATGDNDNALANYLMIASGNASSTSQPQLVIKYHVP